jgi:hypothetical protein
LPADVRLAAHVSATESYAAVYVSHATRGGRSGSGAAAPRGPKKSGSGSSEPSLNSLLTLVLAPPHSPADRRRSPARE